MDPICEKKGYYGDVQFGFRTHRSTVDCVFMLLAAVRRAKKKGYCISVAFCDIAKAYDSVNRELLYLKLDSIGFGGRVKSLIQSMYYNDCVQIKVNGGLSPPLWFTKGVNQGCVLSPMLFSLYISGLGRILHSLQEGIDFDGVVISALFFADDLVLISRTKKRGLERMLRVVGRFCEGMQMRLAVSKTVIISGAAPDSRWSAGGDEGSTLEAAYMGKYLGVEIQVKGRNLIKHRESKMIMVATNYAHTIMGVTRTGLDRALVAHKLWECCAIPSILYCVDASVNTKSCIMKLERIQHQIARFILQLPKSAAKVCGYVDAGLKPIQARIDTRCVMFAWKVLNGKRSPMLRHVMETVLKDNQDPWTSQLLDLCGEQGIAFLQNRLSCVRKVMHNSAVTKVLNLMREHVSLWSLPQPVGWFKLQRHVNDSSLCGVLSRFRAGDAGLGNRRPTLAGKTYKSCPLCSAQGINNVLNEPHVVLQCQSVSFERQATGILDFASNYSGLRKSHLVLKDYLGGDDAEYNVLHQRAQALGFMLDTWLGKVDQL